MGSNSCYSKFIADVFHPWHCVNTYLSAAGADGQLTKYLLNSCGSSTDVVIFSPIASALNK